MSMIKQPQLCIIKYVFSFLPFYSTRFLFPPYVVKFTQINFQVSIFKNENTTPYVIKMVYLLNSFIMYKHFILQVIFVWKILF
jgi:hypothetical protein